MHELRLLLSGAAIDLPLDRAALAIAKIEHPILDPEPWVRELDRIAHEVALRAADLDNGRSFLETLQRYLFQELGFHGNRVDYYDPRNSCLNDVLAFRTGIPITLSIVLLEVGRRLAKPLYGIGAPGHFLVEYYDGKRSIYMDAFNGGRFMRREQCLEVLRELTGRDASPSMLVRNKPKEILTRVLRNLEAAYIRRSEYEKALQATDLLRLASERSIPRFPLAGN